MHYSVYCRAERKQLKPKLEFKHIFNDYHIREDGKLWSNKGKGKYLIGDICDGFRRYRLAIDRGIYKRFQAHHLVMEHFGYPKPSKGRFIVVHKDGDKSNNHINNLRWGTFSEPIQKGYDTNSRKDITGDNNPNSKKRIKL